MRCVTGQRGSGGSDGGNVEWVLELNNGGRVPAIRL